MQKHDGMNYAPTGAARAVCGKGEFRIVYPKADFAMTFKGIVTGYEPGEIVVDDKLSASFTIKCSGKPVIAAHTP